MSIQIVHTHFNVAHFERIHTTIHRRVFLYVYQIEKWFFFRFIDLMLFCFVFVFVFVSILNAMYTCLASTRGNIIIKFSRDKPKKGNNFFEFRLSCYNRYDFFRMISNVWVHFHTVLFLYENKKKLSEVWSSSCKHVCSTIVENFEEFTWRSDMFALESRAFYFISFNIVRSMMETRALQLMYKLEVVPLKANKSKKSSSPIAHMHVCM